MLGAYHPARNALLTGPEVRRRTSFFRCWRPAEDGQGGRAGGTEADAGACCGLTPRGQPRGARSRGRAMRAGRLLARAGSLAVAPREGSRCVGVRGGQWGAGSRVMAEAPQEGSRCVGGEKRAVGHGTRVLSAGRKAVLRNARTKSMLTNEGVLGEPLKWCGKIDASCIHKRQNFFFLGTLTESSALRVRRCSS